MVINGLFIIYRFSDIILDFDLFGLHLLLKGFIFLILGVFLVKNIRWSVIGGMIISLDGFLVILERGYFWPNSITLALFLIFICKERIEKKMKGSILKEMKKKLDEDYIEDRISREEYQRRKKEFEEEL